MVIDLGSAHVYIFMAYMKFCNLLIHLEKEISTGPSVSQKSFSNQKPESVQQYEDAYTFKTKTSLRWG